MTDFMSLYYHCRRNESIHEIDNEFHSFMLSECYEVCENDFKSIITEMYHDEDCVEINVSIIKSLDEVLQTLDNGIHRVAYRKYPRLVFDMIEKTYELDIEDCSEASCDYFLKFNNVIECVA
jgi:hypothetical protein